MPPPAIRRGAKSAVPPFRRFAAHGFNLDRLAKIAMKNIKASQEIPPLLSVRQFAHAVNLTDHTIYQWIKAGRIQIVRLARNIRIPAEELAKLQTGGIAR